MRWSNILRLYPGRLRARLGQELFAFTGIVAGVALLFAVQVSNASLSSSIAQLTTGLVGRAQVQVIARDAGGLRERIVSEVAHSPDIQAVAPVLEASADLLGPRGHRAVTLLAADQRVARLGGTLLPSVAVAAFPRLTAVILPAQVATAVGAQLGAATSLRIAGHTLAVPVAAVLGHSAIGALAEAPVVLAPLALGQALAGMEHRVSRIYVLARAGREARVRRFLARLAGTSGDVRPANFDTKLFAQAAEPNAQSTSLFSEVTALVGFLFAFNAMLLMARDRRSASAQLGIAGHSNTTLLRILALDALVLAIVASIVGLVLGDQISRHVFPPAPGYLSIGFPIGTARTIHRQTFALAFAAGVGATLLGTLAPLLVSRPEPGLDGDRDRESPGQQHAYGWRMLSLGALGLLATTLVFVVSPTSGRFGIALLVGSMLLCLPAICAAVLLVAQRGSQLLSSLAGAIAVGALRANQSRSAALAGIAAVAVCASGAIEGARQDLQAGLDRAVHGVSATTDVWVSPTSPANQLSVVPFQPDVRREIARLPHVAGVDVFRGALLTIGTRRVWVFGPPPSSRTLVPPDQVLRGDPTLANERVRSGGWAAVSRAIADERHLRLGTRFVLPSPRPRTFRVAAIITNLGWPPGAVVLNADSFRDAWGTHTASALQVRFDDATSPSDGRRLVAAALAHGPWSGLTVETAAERERHQRQSARDGLARLTQIARLVLIAAALAMAIAVGAMILQRRPALATLRLNGLARSRIYRALLLETAILLTIGCATGAVFALFGVQILDAWLTNLTGFPVVRTVGAQSALTSVATVMTVALAVSAVPGYVAANAREDTAFED